MLQKDEDNNKHHIQGLCRLMFKFTWHLLLETWQEFYKSIFVEIWRSLPYKD